MFLFSATQFLISENKFLNCASYGNYAVDLPQVIYSIPSWIAWNFKIALVFFGVMEET